MEDTNTNQDTYYEAQAENPFFTPMDETPKTVYPVVKSDLEDQEMELEAPNRAPFLVERVQHTPTTAPTSADTNLFTTKPDFSEFCRNRYMQIMKSDPIFSLNKQHVSSVIADEWKQIGQSLSMPNFIK